MSNTLKVASVKWMNLDWVAPVYPLEPIAHSTLGKSRPESEKTHMTLMGIEPTTSQPAVRDVNHFATGAGGLYNFIYTLGALYQCSTASTR